MMSVFSVLYKFSVLNKAVIAYSLTTYKVSECDVLSSETFFSFFSSIYSSSASVICHATLKPTILKQWAIVSEVTLFRDDTIMCST